jgi:galactokinase
MREFRAPGRVNLIGDHTDYNEGFVLPLALDLECVVRARRREDGVVRVRSTEFDGEVEVPADGRTEPSRVEPPWGRLVAGIVRSLGARGRAPVGLDAELHSTVPVGKGLSSSAAVEVALALALCAEDGLALDTVELALACQEAEQLATGVPCGIMDQLVATSGRRGSALLIDCRTLALEAVALPAEVAVLVVDSGDSRSLSETAYAERRAECQRIAAALDLEALRDATLEQVAHEPRARHVVTENDRVLAFADALRSGGVEALGPLLLQSHASLRDDFGVSTPELDACVERLVAAGALGARLTGAGFGGCVVALVRADEVDTVAAAAGDVVYVYPGSKPSR